MTHDDASVGNLPKEKSRTLMIGVRVNAEQKASIEMAAEREGLQVSSFIITLLVSRKVLPDSCLRKLKRYPVPLYCALHGLLGVANSMGERCKQLTAALPNSEVCAELNQTHTHIIEATAAIADALRGKATPEGVNLYRLQTDIAKLGQKFNRLVKSVNIGKPDLSGLSATLAAIANAADTITAALTGQTVLDATPPNMKAKPTARVPDEAALGKIAKRKILTGRWAITAKQAKRRKRDT